MAPGFRCCRPFALSFLQECLNTITRNNQPWRTACQVIQRTGPRRSALGAVEWVNSEVAEAVVMAYPDKQASLNYILF